MAGKQTFDRQLAAIEALRHEAPEAAQQALRKALGLRNNYLVAKAADLARELRLDGLIPELLAAFDRFFVDPVKNDPQCWAKNSISRALSALEFQDLDVFLRGMRHIQLEPVWGGTSDTAGTLRATCALALVQCRGLSDHSLLSHLLELFADKDKSVRVEVARAIAQTGLPQAALLLRLRAVLSADEPEVLGACYTGILNIEGKTAIAWLSHFLAGGGETAAEAALAIAQDHSVEAFQVLHRHFTCLQTGGGRRAGDNKAGDDKWFRSVLLSAIALTRQDAACEFLLDLVRARAAHAEAALLALLRSAPPPEIVERLQQIVADHRELARAFAENRPKA